MNGIERLSDSNIERPNLEGLEDLPSGTTGAVETPPNKGEIEAREHILKSLREHAKAETKETDVKANIQSTSTDQIKPESKLRKNIRVAAKTGGMALVGIGAFTGGASALTIGGGALIGTMGNPVGFVMAKEGVNLLIVGGKAIAPIAIPLVIALGFPFALDKVLDLMVKAATGAAPKAAKSGGDHGGGHGGGHH